MASPRWKILPGRVRSAAKGKRISTDDQARGEYNSLETQRDICQHAIAVHQHEGWTATHFIDDPGFSGKNLERPGMQSLLREVRSPTPADARTFHKMADSLDHRNVRAG